jgi:hypothetical protein
MAVRHGSRTRRTQGFCRRLTSARDLENCSIILLRQPFLFEALLGRSSAERLKSFWVLLLEPLGIEAGCAAYAGNDAVALLDHIAEMDADAELDATLGRKI